MTRLTSKTLDSNYDDSSHVEARNQRTTLGGLKPIGKSNHVGPTRTGTAKLSTQQ